MEASGVAVAKVRKTIQGNRFAKCAIETACSMPRAAPGRALSELLGGRVRDALPVAWTLASGDTAQDIAEAQQMLELRRHRIFKLKIGSRSVADDVSHVLAIKRALGDAASVRVDVNQAWSELEAMRGIAALQDGGVDLIEQPVRADNTARWAAWPPFRRRHHGRRGAARPGDAPGLRQQRRRVRGEDYPVGGWSPRSRWPRWRNWQASACMAAPCSKAASARRPAHLCATFADLSWDTELFGLLLTQEILREPLVYRDFMLQVPTGPGLGVQVDTDKLRHLRANKEIAMLFT
jgi:muconate cycloisomerase